VGRRTAPEHTGLLQLGDDTAGVDGGDAAVGEYQDEERPVDRAPRLPQHLQHLTHRNVAGDREDETVVGDHPELQVAAGAEDQVRRLPQPDDLVRRTP
jgi:hypothetical protein